MRGHTLVWPSWSKSPNSIKAKFEKDPNGLRQVILDYIDELAGAFKGQLVEWDVANEVHKALKRLNPKYPILKSNTLASE